MFSAYRFCPKCNYKITHTTVKSQLAADRLAKRSSDEYKLCRSCIATAVNIRRWSNEENKNKQSDRFLKYNPSKGKPAWNKGIPRDEKTKQKIRNTIEKNGGRIGNLNTNFGKFKKHNIDSDFKKYSQRVRVLTERVKHLIPGYDESLRGRVGIKNAYQIDHIKSIVECWYEGYTAEQAADVSNLRFITWNENLKLRKWKKK